MLRNHVANVIMSIAAWGFWVSLATRMLVVSFSTVKFFHNSDFFRVLATISPRPARRMQTGPLPVWRDDRCQLSKVAAEEHHLAAEWHPSKLLIYK